VRDFYTQFDELLASPLLAVLLFGLLRMRVAN
jgi:hypothetical protein